MNEYIIRVIDAATGLSSDWILYAESMKALRKRMDELMAPNTVWSFLTSKQYTIKIYKLVK